MDRPYTPRPPARVGAPASNRDFAKSSAGGSRTRSHSGGATVPPLTEEQQRKVAAWGANYIAGEDSIRNDYSRQYGITGERPQNCLRGTRVEERFSEYPKLAMLVQHKHDLLSSADHSIPPTYLASSSTSSALQSLQPHRFDVILLSPPADTPFEELRGLELGRVAASPGFVWLWVGSGAKGDGIGLEKGRELIAEWGYRRCEDIVWLKTNKEGSKALGSETLFTSTIEHCLMGMRGTVRRSTDPWFVHCNVDTDCIVWEGDSVDPEMKPPELQTLIENFCLGTRRLHLYAPSTSLRRGWLSVSAKEFSEMRTPVRRVEGEDKEWDAVEYDKDEYLARKTATKDTEGRVAIVLPFTAEIDALRPKSPPPRDGMPSSGGLGRGRGAGLGVTRSGMIGPRRGGYPPQSSSQRGPPSQQYQQYPPQQPQYQQQQQQHQQQQQQQYRPQQQQPSQYPPQQYYNPYAPYPPFYPQQYYPPMDQQQYLFLLQQQQQQQQYQATGYQGYAPVYGQFTNP